jgi:hypothetical protein
MGVGRNRPNKEHPMKTVIAAMTMVVLGAFRAVASEGAAPPEFLHAIRLVESGDRYDTPPGKLGEVGPYQFRSVVWRRYTNAPLSAARTSLSDHVASRHYAWIAAGLRRRGVEPNPWNVAAAWNSGLKSVVSGRIPACTRDYADRVVNLIACDKADLDKVRVAR